jgi:hypothetical protein
MSIPSRHSWKLTFNGKNEWYKDCPFKAKRVSMHELSFNDTIGIWSFDSETINMYKVVEIRKKSITVIPCTNTGAIYQELELMPFAEIKHVIKPSNPHFAFWIIL